MTFVCLSKSKKPGGYCVAGKIINDDGSIGQWVRPLNSAGSIDDHDCLYKDDTYAKPFDIIQAIFKNPIPKRFQNENHLIDSNEFWIKTDDYTLTKKEVLKLCDAPATLWKNKHQSGSGKFDQVLPSEAININQSLYFIYVDNITFHISKWQQEPVKVRGEFIYNNITYNLRVTDLIWIDYFKNHKTGAYSFQGRFVTVSLALETHTSVTGTHHYKIIAMVK